MKYSYADMPDKTLEGIKKEVEVGLATIAVYFETTLGVPLEIFQEMLETKLKTGADSLLFYMNFRNKHPELFTTQTTTQSN